MTARVVRECERAKANARVQVNGMMDRGSGKDSEEPETRPKASLRRMWERAKGMFGESWMFVIG